MKKSAIIFHRAEMRSFICPSIGFKTDCIDGTGFADSGDNANLKRRNKVDTIILISIIAKRWPMATKIDLQNIDT
jgi:hypothetical protein